MSSAINWGVMSGDVSILQHPLYQKYASQDYGSIAVADVKADLLTVLASNESSAVVAYLSSLIRVLDLVAA